ncbi:hypothetical protein A6U92_15155 [Agrobacterium rubi]|nr:hypothetical protein A6U92_15155 [Agrobacterium rubi]
MPWADGPKPGQIVVVHGKDDVKVLEIGRAHLPGFLAGNVDTVAVCDGDRTLIGRIARVPCARPGGIDHELMGDVLFFDQMREDTFRQR